MQLRAKLGEKQELLMKKVHSIPSRTAAVSIPATPSASMIPVRSTASVHIPAPVPPPPKSIFDILTPDAVERMTLENTAFNTGYNSVTISLKLVTLNQPRYNHLIDFSYLIFFIVVLEDHRVLRLN